MPGLRTFLHHMSKHIIVLDKRESQRQQIC